jgi:hypothetical protein
MRISRSFRRRVLFVALVGAGWVSSQSRLSDRRSTISLMAPRNTLASVSSLPMASGSQSTLIRVDCLYLSAPKAKSADVSTPSTSGLV